MKMWVICASLYAAIGLFTFGHIAAEWTGQICNQGAWNESICGADNAAESGFVGAFVWPFYWSWELQESKP